MKLVIFNLIVLFSGVCGAFRNSSVQINSTDVLVKGGENNTELQEEFNQTLVVHRLSGCSWTLRIPGSGGAVAIPSTSTSVLAEQICRDLECGDVYHVNETHSPPNASCFHHCLYQDGRLANCSDSAGGLCSVVSEAVCGHQAVRLAGGADRCSGRVEVWREGRWGTVCDDRWDLRDADVVCQQLGCGYALGVTGQGDSAFPLATGPVHLDELNCTGAEENLWACPGERGESDCGHKEDAGVVCSEMRAVRLRGGLDRCSGTVEIHRNGSWGTVCDNCWDQDMASMVCSMLRCGAAPLKYKQFDQPLPHNDGPLWFYACAPDAQDLWQCQEFINNSFLCATSKASALVCNGSLGLPAATTDNSTAATVQPTEVTTPAVGSRAGQPILPPVELLVSIVVCLLLLVLLVTNTVLCCHYRRRHALLIQQTSVSKAPPPEHLHKGPVSLMKVTTCPPQPEAAPGPRYLWTQLSSVDSASVDTDFEPSDDPSAPLSTFQNSQRHRTNAEPPMAPSGLGSAEAGPETTGPSVDFGGLPSDLYTRVSKISADSFDSSSTSSGETYENTRDSYVMVVERPCDAATDQTVSKGSLRTDPLHDTAGDEDPIYSPVSPDRVSASEDDYDDVGAV